MRLTFLFNNVWALMLIAILSGAAPVWAAPDVDLQSLELFNEIKEFNVSARSPHPASKIAENTSVITSEQIEALHAHTLAEVLNTVPGFQTVFTRTPGSVNFFFLQGANNSHVQVYIDGVPQNDPNNVVTQIGQIPVQHIDRIEIIKGAASAAWGSALGGVINVITKSPSLDSAATGSLTTSIGARSTSEVLGELTGSSKRLGYYFSGGYLHSDGLLPYNGVNFPHAYGKIVYELASNQVLTLGASTHSSRGGIEEVAWLPPPNDWRDSQNSSVSYYFLNYSHRLAERLTLELTGRYSRQDLKTLYGNIAPPTQFKDFRNVNLNWGGDAKVVWGGADLNLTAGFDYEHVDVKASEPLINDPFDNFAKQFDRFGYFANGTVSVGAFTFLPGARFDQTGSNGDLASYTLGGTFRLTEQTVLRGYWARGYSLPRTLFEHGPQRVWTTQVGIESSDVPFVWLKGTFFYNNTWNIEDTSGSHAGNVFSQIRQGVEVEGRTVPWRNFSLGAGFTFSDVRDRDTHAVVAQMPRQVVKISGQYENRPLGVLGVLTGNFAQWNYIEQTSGKENFVWDLSLTKTFASHDSFTPEIFFTGHNLFNSSQYIDDHFKNAGRWFEGGVRCKF